jgi:nucleotide-binding universal stress UspA family protein
MTDEAPRVFRIRRVVVGLDGSRRSRTLLAAAARLAHHLEAQLEGVYVEEEQWLRTGPTGTIRIVGSYTGAVRAFESADLDREIRSTSRRLAGLLEEMGRKLQLESTFRKERGRPEEVLLRAASNAELITLGVVGHTPGGVFRIGSTARALAEQSETPLLLLPDGGRISPLVLLVEGSDVDPARSFARALASGFGSSVVPLRGIRTVQDLLRRLMPGVRGVLVIPRNAPLLARGGLEALLYRSGLPVALV